VSQLSFGMLSVIMLCVVILSVVGPSKRNLTLG
jgi:hypothetical protein